MVVWVDHDRYRDIKDLLRRRLMWLIRRDMGLLRVLFIINLRGVRIVRKRRRRRRRRNLGCFRGSGI
jgi:hypothetical protein